MKRRYILTMTALTAVVSGFCGLVYLVIWGRLVQHRLGGDAVSTGIIAAICLLGLGFGACLYGRRGRGTFRILLITECGIGLFGALGFHLIAPVTDALFRWIVSGPDASAEILASVILGSCALLLPLSVLIGGALPLRYSVFTGLRGESAPGPGLIHACLSLGAGLGMAALPLLLLNRLSLPATLAVCGALNIMTALLVAVWSQGLATAREPAGGAPRTTDATILRIAYALAFASGMVMTGCVLSLLRALPIANPSSAYNFPLVLALFLCALAPGSLLYARAAPAGEAALYRAGALLAGAAPAMFLGIWIASHLQAQMYPVSLLPFLDGAGHADLPWALLFCVTLIMPAPFLLGAVLPLLSTLASADSARNAGMIYMLAFLGGFCGLILGRFAGIPLLGTQGFLTFLYVLACIAGTGAMSWVWRCNRLRGLAGYSGALAGGLLALAAMVALVMPSGIWLTYITGGPEQNWEVREGTSGIAQLWWEEEHADVRVNGEYMSRLPYHPRHVKQEIFLLAQPRREKVLVLGMGAAEIIRSLVEDPEVKRIDIVERSHELPGILVGGRADEMLNGALRSPKIRILTADPRVAVGLYPAETFDLVFDNLAFAWWAGATAVKSEAYFREIRRILVPEGVFLTGANYTARSRSAVLAGLVNVFEVVKEHRHAEIVIATSREPAYFDFRIIQLTEPRAAIFGLNYTAPDALPAWFRNEFIPVGSAGLLGVEPVRDDLLIYEFFWKPF